MRLYFFFAIGINLLIEQNIHCLNSCIEISETMEVLNLFDDDLSQYRF